MVKAREFLFQRRMPFLEYGRHGTLFPLWKKDYHIPDSETSLQRRESNVSNICSISNRMLSKIEDETEKGLYRAVSYLRKNEFGNLIWQIDVVPYWEAKISDINYDALAQHYGFEIHLLDLTNDITIKGADLAYRLYPDAALRVFCDWDIWFHPNDCERALTVLAEDGWIVPEASSTNFDADQMKGRHHFLGHVRGQYRIEPHFTLANFEEIAPNEMWSHTLDYLNGDGQRVLSPEMNLLMLTRHAASKSYYHAQLPKLLTDVAMVMKNENVNFDKLRELANKWKLPYSGDLLAAFPEFFPSDVIAEFKADSKKVEAFRRIFETRGRLGEQETATLLLSRYEVHGQIASGVMKLIMAHTPSMMRLIYHLPEHGVGGRVLWAYACWFWTRTWRVRSWIRRDPLLREYAHMVETTESGNVS